MKQLECKILSAPFNCLSGSFINRFPICMTVPLKLNYNAIIFLQGYWWNQWLPFCRYVMRNKCESNLLEYSSSVKIISCNREKQNSHKKVIIKITSFIVINIVYQLGVSVVTKNRSCNFKCMVMMRYLNNHYHQISEPDETGA